MISLLVFECYSSAQRSNKPNILFIAIDDLKPELGCYGNTIIKTPNIDRLAKMGTLFASNYVQQAVCGPTRASVMTGMRPDVTKVWDLKTQMRDMNPDIVTLPQYLITQGYTTCGGGKIFHPSSALKKIDPISWNTPYIEDTEADYPKGMGKPANRSYQKPETKQIFLKAAAPREATDDDDLNPTSRKGPSTECIDVPDNAYEDGVLAVKSKEKIIELTKAGNPFFLAVGFHKPHLPFVAPKKYWDMYKRDEMPVAQFQEHSKNGPEIAYHRSGELRNYLDIPEFANFNESGNHINLKIEKQKELIHGYYAATSYTDANVGILLNTLDSLGILNNTIIVLWGDHGWHLGDHDLWEKHTNFEQDTRAPLIVASPNYKSGKTNSLTEHLDIFPTVCNLAGVPIPTWLEGKSLVPLMQNKNASIKEYSVSQYPRKLNKEELKKMGYANNKIMGYSIRTSQYRYTVWMSDFTTKDSFSEKKVYAREMYDYKKDPLEKVNIVDDKAYATASSELNRKMLDFFLSQQKK